MTELLQNNYLTLTNETHFAYNVTTAITKKKFNTKLWTSKKISRTLLWSTGIQNLNLGWHNPVVGNFYEQGVNYPTKHNQTALVQ
jgi:nitric oxide reductase large subunit